MHRRLWLALTIFLKPTDDKTYVESLLQIISESCKSFLESSKTCHGPDACPYLGPIWSEICLCWVPCFCCPHLGPMRIGWTGPGLDMGLTLQGGADRRKKDSNLSFTAEHMCHSRRPRLPQLKKKEEEISRCLDFTLKHTKTK